MNKFFFFFSNLAVWIFLDQATKIYVRNNLPIGKEHNFINDFISFIHIENKGISFGLFGDLPGFWSDMFLYVLIAATSLAILFIAILLLKKIHQISYWEILSLSLIIAGGIGNNIDRLFFGKVTDFTYFKFFGKGLFINNVADDFISIGLAILFVLFFLKKDNLFRD